MIGKKGKIIVTINGPDGTLYAGAIIKIVQSENEHLRVQEDSGKIWFVDKTNIKFLDD